jgi:glycosyltransferase involved in cell wall biosynthesis
MISYYLPSGSKIGVGYQVHELANELVRRGHHVDVFSECPPVDGALYGHRHIRLRGGLRTFRFATRLRREDFSSYDVLHAHGDDYWMWRRRVPAHVRTLHGSCFEEALRIRGAKERLRMVLLGFSEVLATLAADVSVAVSPTTLRWTPWVSKVIPNGVDTQRFRPRPEMRADTPVILFVGTWNGRKRGAELARAFTDHVRPAIPEAQLWMVTQDAPPDPGEGVRVLGRLSDDLLADVYNRAWVFCLPSTYEGFGIPYAEAMLSGLPVVATPNVGARYVTDEGRAGVLVPVAELGPRLRDLLLDADELERLRVAGLARATEFTLDSVVTRYETLYRQVRR